MADRTEDTDLPPFEAEFARAWDTPGHTRYQLPDTDVNAVLATRYATGEPLTLTRGMLWDMEVRKAAYPGRATSRTWCGLAAIGPGTGTAASQAAGYRRCRWSRFAVDTGPQARLKPGPSREMTIVGAIGVHEFITLDGVIESPSWSFDYSFDPKMGEAIGQIMGSSKAILLDVAPLRSSPRPGSPGPPKTTPARRS